MNNSRTYKQTNDHSYIDKSTTNTNKRTFTSVVSFWRQIRTAIVTDIRQ